jgi:hypothetical protein
MLAAIYGLQALIFIFRLRWDMIAWMLCKSPCCFPRIIASLTNQRQLIVYILAIPAFSFFLPLYSFWYMDNFSWGNTRVVLGESGKKVVIHVSHPGSWNTCSDIYSDNCRYDRMRGNSILDLSLRSRGVNTSQSHHTPQACFFWLI